MHLAAGKADMIDVGGEEVAHSDAIAADHEDDDDDSADLSGLGNLWEHRSSTVNRVTI